MKERAKGFDEKSYFVGSAANSHKNSVEAAAKADRDETPAAIREGLADMKGGRSKPARAALEALAKKYGIG